MTSPCEFGHKDHLKKVVNTEIGPMLVYDWEEYKDLPSGQCAGRDDVSRTLANQGWWERAETNLIKSILENGNKDNLILDVGANVGYYSKMAQNYGYNVIAYDFIEESLEIVKNNANKAKTIQIWFDNGSSVTTGLEKFEVELLKVDIEGNDQFAIKYFEPILPKVKNIVIEVSPVFNDSYPKLIEKIKSSGFEILELDGTPFNFDYNFSQRDLWCRRLK